MRALGINFKFKASLPVLIDLLDVCVYPLFHPLHELLPLPERSQVDELAEEPSLLHVRLLPLGINFILPTKSEYEWLLSASIATLGIE